MITILNGYRDVGAFKAALPKIIERLAADVDGVETCSVVQIAGVNTSASFRVNVQYKTTFTVNLVMNEINGTHKLRVDIVPAFIKKGF